MHLFALKEYISSFEQNMDTTTRNRRKIDCKPELIIVSLQKFYANYEDIDTILPYLQGTADLSLRLIDWFVTNYCRKHFIGYALNGQEFLVYISYKSQLKAYSKQYFDPNCRRERIMFQIPGYESFLTTVGKLNFFRWAIETKLIDYIQENFEEIQAERNEAIRNSDKKSREPATESSVSSIRTVSSLASAATMSSTDDDAMVSPFVASTANITRRRRTKQIPAASRQLQKHDMSITVSFD